MNKSDYLDWKASPVTEQVFAQLRDRIAYYTDCLIASAGKNPIEDAANSGAIRAYQDVLNIDFIDEETQ